MDISFSYCFYFILIMLIPLNIFHPSSAAVHNEEYETCTKPFWSGTIENISYPFYDGKTRPSYCGYPGFQLNCSEILPQLSVTPSEKYYLVETPNADFFAVARVDYWGTYCPPILFNTTINFNLFNSQVTNENITLYYECSTTSTRTANQFSCTNMSSNTSIGYFMTEQLEPTLGRIPLETCKSKVFVPAFQSSVVGISATEDLKPALHNGFGLQWFAENDLCNDCRGSGGECGYNSNTSSFTCYCPDQPYIDTCNGTSSSSLDGCCLTSFWIQPLYFNKIGARTFTDPTFVGLHWTCCCTWFQESSSLQGSPFLFELLFVLSFSCLLHVQRAL